MLVAHLHKFLTAPSAKISSGQFVFWFTLSITCALLFGFLSLQEAFGSDCVVQDDAMLDNTLAGLSLRRIVALTIEVFLLLLLDILWLACSNTRRQQSFTAILLAAIVAMSLISYSTLLVRKDFEFPDTGYQAGKFPKLSEFFAQ